MSSSEPENELTPAEQPAKVAHTLERLPELPDEKVAGIMALLVLQIRPALADIFMSARSASRWRVVAHKQQNKQQRSVEKRETLGEPGFLMVAPTGIEFSKWGPGRSRPLPKSSIFRGFRTFRSRPIPSDSGHFRPVC